MDGEVEFQGKKIFGLYISVGDLVNMASQSGLRVHYIALSHQRLRRSQVMDGEVEFQGRRIFGLYNLVGGLVIMASQSGLRLHYIALSHQRLRRSHFLSTK